MNRKKIKSMLIMMGTMLSLNMGNQIEAKAVDVDSEKASVEAKAEVSANKSKPEISKKEAVSKTNDTNDNKALANKQEEKMVETTVDTYVNKTVKAGADITDAIGKVNAGTAIVNDFYNTLRIDSVNGNNLSTVKEAIRREREELGRDLNQGEIVDVANNSAAIYTLLEDIKSEIYIENDYIDADIFEVKADNVKEISPLILKHDFVRGKEISKFAKKIISAESSISSGSGSLTQYETLEVKGVNSEILAQINNAANAKSVSKKTTLTIAEIKQVVKEELAKNESLEKINSGNAELKDFDNLYVNGVTTENFKFIEDKLKGKNYKTREDIQQVVNDSIEYLNLVKKVCNGDGNLKDFETLNISGVTDGNISAVNINLRGKGYSAIDEVQKVVNKTLDEILKERIIRIENGSVFLSDFNAIGVKGVTSQNFDFIKSKLQGNTFSTVEEVQKAVDPLIKLYNSIKAISDGKAVLTDYANINDQKVTGENINFVNSKIKGNYITDEDKLRDKVDEEVELYNSYVKVNNGEATKKDYDRIGARKVTYDIVDKINISAKGRFKNYTDFTLSNVQQIVDAIVGRLDSIRRINDGKAQTADFIYLDIHGVTDDNLIFMNVGLKGKGCTSEAEIQNLINNLLDIYAAITDMNEGNATLKEYAILDKDTLVNEDNLYFVNAYVKGCKDYTIIGMTKKVSLALRAYTGLCNVNKGIADIDDFIALGVTDIEESKLQLINSTLRGSSFKYSEEVKEAVGKIINSTVYLERINGGNAYVSDYSDLGVEGVNESNRRFVNAYISNKSLKNVAEVKDAVKTALYAYDITAKINRGEGTLEDYDFIKASGVTKNNIKYVNSYVMKNNAMDLVELVNEKIATAEKEFKSIEKINNGSELTEDFEFLGIADVYSTNIDYIKKYIKENEIIFNVDAIANKTVNQVEVKKNIQKVVNDALKKYKCITKINGGYADVSDYELLGILNEVNEKNKVYVNSHLSGNQSTDVLEIKKKVISAVANFGAIERIDTGNATVEDYFLIIGGEKNIDPKTGEKVVTPYVTNENILYINPIIKGKGYNNPSAILDFVIDANKQYESLTKINNGTAIVSDYTGFGIEDVNEANLKNINAYVSHKHLKTVDDLYEAVKSAKKRYEAIERIIQGQAQEGDFVTLKIEGVNKNNLGFVNTELKDTIYESDSQVSNEVTKALEAYNAVTRIKNGEGYLGDYALLEDRVKDADDEKGYSVNNNNLNYVNKNIANTTLVYSAELVQKIRHIVKDYSILLRIDKGQATVDEYKEIGVAEINSANVGSVNDTLKLKGYYKNATKAISDVKENAAIAINSFSAISKINSGDAHQIDYETLGLDKIVTGQNIDFINANIKGTNLTTVENVKTAVEYWAKRYTSFSRINSGIAAVDDYTTLGLTGVDSSNLVYANADLKEKYLLTNDKLQAVINAGLKGYAALAKINDGKGTEENYRDIGVVSKFSKDNHDIEFLNDRFKTTNSFTATEASQKAEKLLSDNGSYGRIRNGQGTLNDYKVGGASGVDNTNINYINTEIKGRLDIFGTNLQTLINSIKHLYSFVDDINKGAEHRDNNTGLVIEYNKIADIKITFDTSADSKLNLIKRAIKLYKEMLNGRPLTKLEIIDIIKKIDSYTEDAKYVLGRIEAEISSAKSTDGVKVDAKKENEIVTNLLQNITGVVERIFSGDADFEDYNSLGERGVTESNIKAINDDVKNYGNKYGDVLVKLSNYRLSGVELAVRNGNAILAINNGGESAAVDEYKALGISMSYDVSTKSILTLVRQEIKLKRQTLGMRNLDRQEIKDIVNYVKIQYEDELELLSEIVPKVETERTEKGGDFTPKDEEKFIEDIKQHRKEAISRIVSGNGKLEDYRYFGKNNVDEDNIKIINQDINDYHLVTKVSDYRLNGLDEAVNTGIAIYQINKSIDGTSTVGNYASIGVTITHDTKGTSRFVIIDECIKIERLRKDNAYLTRNEILEIVKDVDTNFGDKQVIIPLVRKTINERLKKGDELKSADINEIQAEVEKSVKEKCDRVKSGNGLLSDYQYFNELNVNKDNIEVINTDIRLKGTVGSASIYRLEGLKEAVQKGIDVYYINKYNDKQAQAKFTNIGAPLLYSAKDTDEFMIVFNKIKLERALGKERYLTRDEIINIVNFYNDTENLKDGQVTLSLINKKLIEEKEKNGNKDLTVEQMRNVITQVESDLMKVCDNIYYGRAKITDYSYLGKKNITDNNADIIDIINEDIQKSGKVSKASKFRLNGLDEEILDCLAIYNINHNSDSTVSASFKRLFNKEITSSSDPVSKFRIILSKISIEKALEGVRYLNKAKIADIIKYVEENYEDEAIIIPRVNEKLTEDKKTIGKDLTAKQIQEDIEVVKSVIKEKCARVAAGIGDVEDFNYLGYKDVVNDKNIDIIKEDILASHLVELKSGYRVYNLEEAIKQALAVYMINNNNDAGVESAYSKLNLKIPYSTDPKSIFAILHSKIEIEKIIRGVDHFDRNDIKRFATEVQTNQKDLEITLPLIYQAINDEKNNNTSGEISTDKAIELKNKVEKDLMDICERLLNGIGTIEDYRKFNETRVTDANREIINNDIKNNKSIIKLSNFRVDKVTEAVDKGLAVYNINNRDDIEVAKAFDEFKVKIDYDTSDTSMYSILMTKLKMEKILQNKAYLERKDILSIVQEVQKDYEDLKVTMPKIKDAIQVKETSGEKKLTPEDIKNIKSKIENDISAICDRIIKGNGEISDYKYLGQDKVNANNIKVINADIKEHQTVTKASNYRLNDLDNAVKVGIAIFNINNANLSEEVVKDFDTLNIKINPESDPRSRLKIIESEIMIHRKLKDNGYLSRDEIEKIVADTDLRLDDEIVYVPEIMKRISEAGSNLKAADVQKIIDETKAYIKKLCEDISSGKGTLEEYKFLGEERVDDSNYKIISDDIRAMNNVSILGNYRLKGLSEAVTQGIAIYEINRGTEKVAIQSFKEIGTNLTYETAPNSLLKLIQAAIKIKLRINDNKYLTRAEINTIIDNVRKNQDDAAIVIPEIDKAIKIAESDPKTHLDSGNIKDIVNKVKNDLKQVIVRICSGNASIKDYLSVGISDMNEQKLQIANGEVIEFKTISAASDYRLNDVTKALKIINALYRINLGQETKRFDTVYIKNKYDNTMRHIDTNFRVAEYEDLGTTVLYDESSDSEYTLMRDLVHIRRMEKGKFLTRNEIIDQVLLYVENNLKDSQVMIPRIYTALLKKESDSKNSLTVEDAKNTIAEQENIMKEVINRIAIGRGTAADFNFLGEKDVDEDNVNAINADIRANLEKSKDNSQKNPIRKVSDYRLEGLKEGVNIGLAIYKINLGKVSTNCDEYALLGENIDYSDSKTSLFKLLESYISITRQLKNNELLNRDEIIKCINEIKENLDDMRLLIPMYNTAINDANQKGKIDAQGVQNIINDINTKISTSVNKVYQGIGEIQDFKNLGEKRVTEANIKCINADIKAKNELTQMSKYRIKGLSEQVTKGIALYYINLGQIHENEAKNVREFAELGQDIAFDYSSTSKCRLITNLISLRKIENENVNLDREAVLKAINDVLKEYDKYRILVPQVMRAKYEAEEDNQAPITTKALNEIIAQKQTDIAEIINRIFEGHGRVADYKVFGEYRVNTQNKNVIGQYIVDNLESTDENKIVRVGDYAIRGLKEAVDRGIAIYNLNRNTDTAGADGYVEEFETLGLKIKSDGDNLSEDKLIMMQIQIARRLKDDRDIGIDDIMEAVSYIHDDLKGAREKIPNILKEIYDKDHESNSKINGKQVKVIVDKYNKKATPSNSGDEGNKN